MGNKNDELVFCLSRLVFDGLLTDSNAVFEDGFLSADLESGKRLLGRLIDLFDIEESRAVRVRRTKRSLLVRHPDIVPAFGFCRRGDCEQDRRYLQVIPYMVCTYDGLSLGDDVWHILSYWRTDAAGEQRLAGGCSIGIGGHLNADDFVETDRSSGLVGCLKTCASREFFEEVKLKRSDSSFFPFESGNYRFLGFIFDDSNDVGAVHLGFVYEIFLPSEEVKPRDPAVQCFEFYALQRAFESIYDYLESWSSVLLRYFRRSGQ